MSRVDAQFHRGSLALVAAAPGVGKSAFAMNFALAAQVPTLYISMDTSPGDQVVRIVQNRLEKSRDIAEALLHESRRSNAWQALEKVNWIEWQFRSGIDTSDITKMVFAYAETKGEWPTLVIVDNLANIAYDGDEFRELRRIALDLEYIAKHTGSCVMALTHVGGVYKDGNQPVPASGIMGKISELPSLILTLYRDEVNVPGAMMVSVVKNRSGRAEPSGRPQAQLQLDLSTMRIWDDRPALVRSRDYLSMEV